MYIHMGLGEKLTKSINTLGRKAENSVNKLGQKTNQTFRKIDNTINRADNVASNIIDKTANTAQNIVAKSGKVTDALRVGANVGNTIVSNLNRAGLADVPMIGTVSKLAETGTNALSKGANKLDAKRDQMARQIENTRANAQIEKDNLRKKIEAQKDSAQEKLSFV
jgi:cell division septum initiation protein DivIVA